MRSVRQLVHLAVRRVHSARLLLAAALVICAPGIAAAITLPASCTSFTDNPLVAGQTVIKAVHLTELRACIADLRALEHLSAPTWTDATIVAGTTVIKAVHITELRAALAAVFTAVAAPAPTYTSTPASGVMIQAIHINEIRAAIAFLASWSQCNAST